MVRSPLPSSAARTAPLSAFLLSLALAGCPRRAPPPPTDVTLSQGSVFEELQITWTPPAVPVDSFGGQARVQGGAWEDLGTVPGDSIGATIGLLDTAPEVITVDVRIRSVRGGKAGDWSPEVTFTRGPRWPTATSTTVSDAGITIAWTNTSLVADGVRVYRRDPASDSLLAELPVAAATFTDPGPFHAGAPVDYALATVAAGVESRRADASSSGYPLVPVSGLVASVEPGGVRLGWQRPRLLGQTFVVHRQQGLAPGTFDRPLGPAVDADQYFDPSPPPGGYDYGVETLIDGAPSGAFVQVPAFVPPEGPPALDATLRVLPIAVGVARDDAGRLAFAIGPTRLGQAEPFRLAFDGAGSPPDHDLGDGLAWATPPVAFDPSGLPHALFVGAPDLGGAAPLVHAWYDGLAWQQEEVARRTFVEPVVGLAIDAAGGLHAAWTTPGPPVLAEYARRGAAGWTIEDLSAAIAAPATLLALAADAGGAPAVLVQDGALDHLLLRGGGAPAWTAAAAPDRSLALAPRDLGWSLAFERLTPGTGTDPGLEYVVQPWTAAGPGADEVAFALVQALPLESPSLVVRDAPDRQVAWASPIGSRLELAIRTAGAWSALTAQEGCICGAAWIDAAGKVGLICQTHDQPLVPTETRYWVSMTER